MDNIGPIALFIIYMAISAWAKKNKAQRRAAQESPTSRPAPKDTLMGGIFEQLKKELLETEEEPLAVPYVEPDREPEVEIVIDDVPTAQFVEGSGSLLQEEGFIPHSVALTSGTDVRSLESILEPYSKIEQGILLHEILGRPRAYQDNDDWFHKS